MNKRIPIWIGFIFILISLWLLMSPSEFIRQTIDEFEDFGYDIQLQTRIFTERPTPSSSIVIVDIDDKSLKNEGRWPWPRNKLAELVDKIQKQGAVVIAFDMFFAEKENNIADVLLTQLNKKQPLNPAVIAVLKENAPLFDNDAIFAKSLADSTSVLAFGFLPRRQTQSMLPPPIYVLSPEQQKTLEIVRAAGYISNIAVLQEQAKGGGFLNIFPDSDGVIRHAPMVIQYQGKLYASLALQAVLTFLGEQVKLITPTYNKTRRLEGIAIGSTVIPTDARGQVFIPFIGKSYTFPYISATDLLHGQVAADTLLGKIVFIGTSATGSGDLKATSIQSPFPGVEIQATLANGILTKNFSYRPAWTVGANVVLLIFFGLLAAFLFPYLGPRTLIALILILPPGLLFLNNWIWYETGLILSLFVPVILILVLAIFNLFYGYLFETRRREHLKEMFGQYVPEKHIDEMLKAKRSSYALHGEDREMTVLFADIRNFTSISEGMSAANLVDLLNTFFTPMTEVIFNHRGTIDKYVGDLIMAFWGAPLKDKNHARRALAAALEMQQRSKELHQKFKEHHLPDVKIGIGMNSGVMSVGDMGSRFRRNYTVLGDAVNLASRIEGLTKFYGVDIIVTQYTEQNQAKFVFRQLDRVTVKGKKDGLAIYELICLQSEATKELNHELMLYHKGLEYYFAQKWDDALAIMFQLQETYPEKKIYSVYIERIKTFQAYPPAPDWDGIYAHANK